MLGRLVELGAQAVAAWQRCRSVQTMRPKLQESGVPPGALELEHLRVQHDSPEMRTPRHSLP